MSKRSPLGREPPTLASHQAIDLIRQQLSRFERLSALRRDDSEVTEWLSASTAVLDGAFGKFVGGHGDMANRFLKAGPFMAYRDQCDVFYERQHQQRLRAKKAILESCIEQLER